MSRKHIETSLHDSSANISCFGLGVQELEILGLTLVFLFDCLRHLLESSLLIDCIIDDGPRDAILQFIVDFVHYVTVNQE